MLFTKKLGMESLERAEGTKVSTVYQVHDSRRFYVYIAAAQPTPGAGEHTGIQAELRVNWLLAGRQLSDA